MKQEDYMALCNISKKKFSKYIWWWNIWNV